MRIVHVVESFAAGTFGMVQALSRGQADDGHQVILCYSLRSETPPDWRALLHPAIECHALPMRRALSPLADLRALLQLGRLLRRLRPDIVHLHSSKAGALGRLLSPWLRRPRWFFSPHGWSFLQVAQPGKVHRLYWLLEWLLSRLPVQLIACSPGEAQLAQRWLGCSAHIVCNGIEIQPPLPAPAHPGVIHIGTAGRISQPRNPQLFRQLALSLQDAGLRWFWLGGGDAADEQFLRDAGIEVSGWMPREQVRQALASLDIYIQPSLWEGMPVAVLEAMRQGLPLVASDIVGNRDLVQHEVNGLLAGDAQQFAVHIRRLLADADLRRRLGQAGRERLLQRYTVQHMLAGMYEVYRR